MTPLKHLRLSDIRGVARLATQATLGVSRIAEGVHQSVWSSLGVAGGRAPGQTGGLTGLVYRGVRSTALFAGECVDAVLAGLQSSLGSGREEGAGTPQREALLAALNGVMGDRLAADDNPFATRMSLRYQRQALDWRALAPMPEVTGKVLLLVHGLCMNDLQWRAQHEGRPVDHGEALASALGYTPVYLRYNSGLHTSENGRELSVHLEQLITHWPTPIEELTVVAHSVGGLVTRSALHYATQASMRWPAHLKSIVFLGTPHHGAPLERAGNWVDVILGGTPFTAPFARLGHVRSAGITDLRYGNLLDEHWRGRDRFQPAPTNTPAVPLPEDVACYAVAATTAARRGELAERLVGDGLVPLRSALGQHDDARQCLAFAEACQWIAYRMNHMELLSSPEVSRQMVLWLTPAAGE